MAQTGMVVWRWAKQPMSERTCMSVVSRVWSADAGCQEPAEGPPLLRGGQLWASEKVQPGASWGHREHPGWQ